MTTARAPGMALSKLLTIGDQTDETGRLLLEDSASKRARRDATRSGVAMRTGTCPYEGSRRGGTMNVSAYEALRDDLGDVLDGLAWLARRYLAMDPSRRGTVQALLDTANLGVTVPLVLFHRAENRIPPQGGLPSYVSSIFKAGRGLFSASVDLLNRRGPGAALGAGEVVAFAEREGHLARAETSRVCAAPSRMIERAVAVILGYGSADPARSRLGELVSFEGLWEFYRLQEAFNQALGRYRLVLEDLSAGPEAMPPEQLFAASVQIEGTTVVFGELTESFLAHVTKLQGALNQTLGLRGDAKPVTFPEVLRML